MDVIKVSVVKPDGQELNRLFVPMVPWTPPGQLEARVQLQPSPADVGHTFDISGVLVEAEHDPAIGDVFSAHSNVQISNHSIFEQRYGMGGLHFSAIGDYVFEVFINGELKGSSPRVLVR